MVYQPSSDFIQLALILSGLSIFFSEAAFLFYNGLLPMIGSKSEYGRLSGLAWGCGYIGAIVALLLVLFILILPDHPFLDLVVIKVYLCGLPCCLQAYG